MEITVLVKSSSQPEPRSVLVVLDDSGLSFVCDCPAGERGRICKHKKAMASADDSEQIQQSDVMSRINVDSKEFILMTIHRPGTVDNKTGLEKLIELIKEASKYKKIVFPIHPRTVDKLKHFNLYDQIENVNDLILTDPLDYFSFQKLIAECKLIITDSGGIQEESTFRKIPCLTLRSSTERPSTIELGTNELITFELKKVKQEVHWRRRTSCQSHQ